MSARQERRPQGGNTNRSERSFHPDELQGSAPATARSDARSTPRVSGVTPRETLQLSRSLPKRQASSASLGTARSNGSGKPPSVRRAESTLLRSTDNQLFARVKSKFTPEQRARQRAMMSEIRNRVEVRHVDIRGAFRELDEDKSGAVDIKEFVGVLKKSHIELPPEDVELLFAFGDTDGSGRVSYDEFCKALERTGPWGNRFFGLEGAETDDHVREVVAKYANKDFASAIRARIQQGLGVHGRTRYYNLLDRDADGYISQEDFEEGSRKLQLPKGSETDVANFFTELGELQGGGGRLNFPLFGELLCPLPSSTGTGPFGQDYRLSEIQRNRARGRRLEEQIAANPIMNRRLSGGLEPIRTWQFEPGEPNASAPGAGPLVGLSKCVGAPPSAAVLSQQRQLATLRAGDPRLPRSLEQSSAEIADGPLPDKGFTHLVPQRRYVPRRSGQPAFARGTHSNLIEPLSESAMFLPEHERLVRPAHFADKWDSGADGRRKQAIYAARTERNAINEMRVSQMVAERQAAAELTDLCHSRSLGQQALWVMERTVGQLG